MEHLEMELKDAQYVYHLSRLKADHIEKELNDAKRQVEILSNLLKEKREEETNNHLKVIEIHRKTIEIIQKEENCYIK